MTKIERGSARGGVTLVRGALLGLATLGALALARGEAQAQAQTQAPGQAPTPPALFADPLFAAPPVVVDYPRYYRWPEECHAAVRRVRGRVAWGTVWTTGELDRWRELLTGEDPRQPAPAPVVETALRCAARFPVATLTDTVDLLLLQETFYAAPDSMLEAVLARRVALAPVDTSRQGRATTLRGAIQFSLQDARPVRVAWVERLLRDRDYLGGEAHRVRYGGYTDLVQFAWKVSDTLAADRYRAALDAVWDSFPERTNPGWAGAHRGGLLDYQRRRALSRGEVVEPQAVFNARRRAVRQGTTLAPADSARIAAAAIAPPIQADFWFRRADSTAPRPTRGKVGYVVFVDARCDVSCYTILAQLRALHEQFGDALQITLVTHTHGFFRRYPPLAPAAEAQRLAQYFFEELKLPGALAVEVTPSTKLPPPDRRRVDQTPANIATYLSQKVLHPATTSPFGLNAEHREGVAVLFVDHQRQVVSSDFIGANVIATYLARAAGTP